MEIKFFSNGKVLDLSGQKISVSEKNSKVSDKKFTQYIFPFEIYMDEEFKQAFGDYSSYDYDGLPKIIDGQLLYENAYRLAKLEVLGSEGDYLTGQIDFGFEDIPNFDKPLKNLPLEKFTVDNIHTFAAETASKKYPQTNFNFPRLYYGKYTPDDKVWDAYNGFVNDMNDDGTALRNNYIDGTGEVYNVNIVHPVPHILYLLKTIFKDAGSNLAGDILTDPFLAQQWVFSGTEYFSRLTQRRLGITISLMEYYKRHKNFLVTYPYGLYSKSVSIPKPGNYKLVANIKLNTYKSGLDQANIKILLNGKILLDKYSRDELNFTFSADVTTVAPDEVISIISIRQFADGDNDQFVICDLFSKDLYSNEELAGEDNGVITNLNEIDLSRAVPDMTCGELVNRVCNLLNYDLVPEDNTMYMNKIGTKGPKNIKVLPKKFLEINPKRNILNKKSFLFRMPTLENGEKIDSLFYDSSGITMNKEPEDLTSVIETNTYALSVYIAKPQGPLTAVVKSYDSTLLQLVKYDGKTGIQNNAKPSPELTFPALFYSNLEPWFRGRLRSVEFLWTFNCDEDELNFNINDEIGCYQNIHIIKELLKDHNNNTVDVSITTETVN